MWLPNKTLKYFLNERTLLLNHDFLELDHHRFEKVPGVACVTVSRVEKVAASIQNFGLVGRAPGTIKTVAGQPKILMWLSDGQPYIFSCTTYETQSHLSCSMQVRTTKTWTNNQKL